VNNSDLFSYDLYLLENGFYLLVNKNQIIQQFLWDRDCLSSFSRWKK